MLIDEELCLKVFSSDFLIGKQLMVALITNDQPIYRFLNSVLQLDLFC